MNATWKMFSSVVVAAFIATPALTHSQQTQQIDPVIVSPDMYKVLLENDHVRVVDYVIEPGQRDQWHTHPPKASYVVSGGTFRITLADSTSFLSPDTTGTASWRGSTPLHYARSVGSTPIHVILVEPKTGFPVASPDQDPASVNPSSVRVMLANESIRVIEAVLPPGFQEKPHHHPGYVTYVLDGGTARLHSADGTTRDSELKPGAVYYNGVLDHWSENIGTTTIRVILFELRDGYSR